MHTVVCCPGQSCRHLYSSDTAGPWRTEATETSPLLLMRWLSVEADAAVHGDGSQLFAAVVPDSG